MTEKIARRKFLKTAGAGLLSIGGLYSGGRALENYLEKEENITLGYFHDQNIFSRVSSELRGRFGNMPNIVVISIDTLRADCVGRELMTGFYDWASESALQFTNAHASSTWTLPSHLSMLSGLTPHEHEVEVRMHVIPKDIGMVQEELQRRGYETVSFNAGGYVRSWFGFSRGFDSWQEKYAEGKDSFSEAERFVSERESSKPVFLFLHTYDVHDYVDPATEREVRKDYKPIYDETVNRFDEKLMRLINGILESSISDNLKMIITSDHGEGFGETYDLYGQEFVSIHHGDFPCPSQVEIPFVVYDSQNPAGGFSDKLVGLHDVPQTLRVWSGIAKTNERYVLSEEEREYVLSEAIPNHWAIPDERRSVQIFGNGQYGKIIVKKFGEAVKIDETGLPLEVAKDLKALGYLQ